MSGATKLKIGPADHGRRMTLDEFQEAEFEAGFRYELGRGTLEVTNIPGEPHGLIVSYFFEAIGVYSRQHGRFIFRLGGAGEFRLDSPDLSSKRHPDVAVALRATPRDARGERRPSLAIEVVSHGAKAHERDHITKRQEYLAYGLDEYWIVDPFERRVIVLVREDNAWTVHV